MSKPLIVHREPISVDELAAALYEGSPTLSNLAEELARQHGQTEALSFFAMMGPDIQNFWKTIAAQLIEHAKHWLPGEGSFCILDDEEKERLHKLPRVTETT